MMAELSLSWSSLRINFWHFDFTSLTVKGQSYKTKINKYDCLTLMVPYAFSSDNYMKKGAGGKKLLDFSYFIIKFKDIQNKYVFNDGSAVPGTFD